MTTVPSKTSISSIHHSVQCSPSKLAPMMELLIQLTFLNKGFLSNFYHRRRAPNLFITVKSGPHRKLFSSYAFFINISFRCIDRTTSCILSIYSSILWKYHLIRIPIFLWTHIKNRFSNNMKQTNSKYQNLNRRYKNYKNRGHFSGTHCICRIRDVI